MNYIKFISTYLILCSAFVHAESITWTPQKPSNDMNESGNWTPNTIPSGGDDAVFNSAISGSANNPTENSAPFTVSTFNFPNKASVFNINFNNQTLTFEGAGITGNQTNSKIQVTNVNTSQGNLVTFNGPASTSGSANLTSSNSGTLLNQVNPGVSDIHSNIFISGPFSVGNNGKITASNEGSINGNSAGGNGAANMFSSQLDIADTFTGGNDVAVSVINTGNNAGITTSAIETIAIVTDQQFFAGSAFVAGDGFSLNVENTGVDTGQGVGSNQIAVINSNSGTTGNQILFLQGCTVGDNATIAATNSGSYTGANTNGGSNVGSMNLQQVVFGDSNSVGSFNLAAGDSFILNVSNEGFDTAQGFGADVVGDVSSDQVTVYAPCLLGDNAEITISNSGTYSGENTSLYVTSGSVGGGQLNFQSTFQASQNFQLSVNTAGTNTCTGIGSSYVGSVIQGQQANFQQGFVVGNNAIINITNEASNATTTTQLNNTGTFLGYGKQFLVRGQFQAADNLSIEISNTGIENSTGSGGNYTAVIFNDTVDNSAAQLHLEDGGSVGNRASINLSNTGTNQGSNSGESLTAMLSGQQLYSVNSFQAGDDFGLAASNTGTQNTSGLNNNTTGVVNNAQVEFGGSLIIGDRATFLLKNSGTNLDATGTGNTVGAVNGQQFQVDGDFTAGRNLAINALNTSTNAGDSSNDVGHIGGSQIFFTQSCTLDDGAFINAFNSGTVGVSQIVFSEGFDIVSGKATIQAINEGTVGSCGIDIEGSNAGGNADIILQNSSLNIGATLPTFTIAGLTGDSASRVQSQPTLVIDIEATTRTTFSGVIQDYPSSVSTLVKAGPGTQVLAGVNTYTGLTTVQEGALTLTGWLAGDVLINPLGNLKGTGFIRGSVTNTGQISPGQSIGTLTMFGNFNNNGGTYNVEVNGAGQSDLLLIGGAANLNGGDVVVTSVDGTLLINHAYTIVTAGAVNGAFTGVFSYAYLTPVLFYDPTHVYLNLLSNLSKAAETCNQLSVAGQLDSIVSPTALQSTLIGAIATLTEDNAQLALDSLSGFQHTNDTWITEVANRQFIRRLYDPLRRIVTTEPCCSCCQDPSLIAWLETGGGRTHFNSSKEAHGCKMDTYEVTGGFQKTLCRDITLGIAGSYENDSISYKHGGIGKRNAGYVGLYGLYRPNEYYVLADLVYGHSDNRIKRTFRAGTLQETAHSRPEISQFTFYGEVGRDFVVEGILVQPFAGIQSGRSWREGILESNANGIGLRVGKHDWTTTSARIGVHLTSNVECFDVSVDLAWNKLLSARRNRVEARFLDFGGKFAVNGTPLDNNGFDYAVSFSREIGNCMRAYLEVGGEVWRHANTWDVLAGIEYSW